ncbi:hypothetical protein B566_EDAN014178 [Ephemera danica]|nr:hypothetical protein B566_EDAN014178 [Ephemera danica]
MNDSINRKSTAVRFSKMSLAARGLLRQALFQIKRNSTNANVIPVRKGHVWSYRTAAPPASKYVSIGAQVVGAYMWWWILWHLWTEPEHIYGEFEYPDPSKWTNEELGIPSDDAE